MLLTSYSGNNIFSIFDIVNQKETSVLPVVSLSTAELVVTAFKTNVNQYSILSKETMIYRVTQRWRHTGASGDIVTT